jgi:acyl carrier protein
MTNLEKLTKVFADTFGVEENEVQNLQYQGIEQWDSVGHMTLIAAIEDEFAIEMDTDDIIDMSSFEKAKEIVTKYNIAL